MILTRKISPIISLSVTFLFTIQLSLQSIPRVVIFHSSDGTECRCGCANLDTKNQSNSHCTHGKCMMTCSCNEDHEKQARFPAQHSEELFIITQQSMVYYHRVDDLVIPSPYILSFLLSKKVSHPPQV